MKIKLIDFGAKGNDLLPVRAHYNDAGLDCFAQEDFLIHCSSHKRIDLDGIVTEQKTVMVPLGFGLEIPDGYTATIRPRSSMNAKGILTQIGTIDSGYRGEIKAIFINLTNNEYVFKKGDKICQIVIEPVILAEPVLELTNDRGVGGFGSTGK